MPRRRRDPDGHRPALPAGARRALAPGGGRGRCVRAALDAHAIRMPRTSRVAALLFASGFCALVYQVAWLREFRLIFGASTAASAAVVAIFIGGLRFRGAFLRPPARPPPPPPPPFSRLPG